METDIYKKIHKDPLRSQLQQQRQALTKSQQTFYSQQICRHVAQSDCFRDAQHIAFYTAVKGEANPLPLQYTPDKSFYLPVLSPIKKFNLIFVKIDANTRYKQNIYAIPEPIYTPKDIIATEDLDLVIMPLVAADRKGNRMGMGGGYYDRSFAFKQTATVTSKAPKLLGFAYDFQLVGKLNAEPWDIPLDYMVTNTKFYKTCRK